MSLTRERFTLAALIGALAALVLGQRCLAAQRPPAKPSFEVASIKPMEPNDGRESGVQPTQPGGQFRAVGLTLRQFLRVAYGNPAALLKNQVVGGPSWVDTDRFEIVAKIPDAASLPDPSHQVSMMLRGLLEERFKISLHMEMQQLPVFEMVLAKRDVQLTPRLHRTTVKCVPMMAARSASDTERLCGFRRIGPGTLSGTGITMPLLAGVLSQLPEVDRLVLDRTGLAGEFDVNLEYQPLRDGSGDAGAPPALFTAVQDQLGLKLESTRGPVEVLVIDHVERPTSN
jgi:bla regulator protein blaR1